MNRDQYNNKADMLGHRNEGDQPDRVSGDDGDHHQQEHGNSCPHVIKFLEESARILRGYN